MHKNMIQRTMFVHFFILLPTVFVLSNAQTVQFNESNGNQSLSNQFVVTNDAENMSDTTTTSSGSKFNNKKLGKPHKTSEFEKVNNNNVTHIKKINFMNEKSNKVSNVVTTVNESENQSTTTTKSLVPLNVINNKTAESAFKKVEKQQGVVSNTNEPSEMVRKKANGKSVKKYSDVLDQDQDFNLDDLEDLHALYPTAAQLDVQNYEAFTLPDEMPPTQTTQKSMMDSDRRHIFKVPRPLLKMRDAISAKSYGAMFNTLDSMSLVVGNQSLQSSFSNSFQILTSMFDHRLWNNVEISKNVSTECGGDMNIYLKHLKMGSEWALKASDASGRYSGVLLFGNDFWMGSQQFCGEVDGMLRQMNRENRYSNHNRKPQVEYFAVRIVTKLEQIFSETKLIQLGQCLPRSCSMEDVRSLLQLDPATALLTQQISQRSELGKAKNQFTLLDIRQVPGSYSLWMDQRFFILSIFVIITTALVIVATCYEAHLKAHDFDIFTTRRQRTTNQNAKTKVYNVKDKCEKDLELNQMNNVNNNVEEINENDMKEKHQRQHPANDGLRQNKLKSIGTCSKLLLCFAAGSNARAILSVEPSVGDALTCVHGLRLYSLLWTILVHTYLQVFTIGENRFYRKISERSFIYQMIGNASFSVDTFFFVSGLLVVLIFLRSLKKPSTDNNKTSTTNMENSNGSSKKENSNIFKTLWKIILYVAYRFCRLTPVYLFIVIFAELSMKWTYNSSVFQPSLSDHITCNKFWWRNILYINNFYPYHEMCMVWSWYLANDMQFYVMAIVLLMFSVRYFKTTSITLIGFLLSSWAVSIYFSLHFNYTHKVSEPFESFDILYDKPWQRVGPYIMGMITAYILHRYKSPPRVSYILNLFLWLVSLSILFALVFGAWNGVLSVPLTALYVSLGHTAWGFALIWITLSCCWGMAAPINGFLSYKGFYPMSRLTYCAYLLHPLIMMLTSFKMQSPIHLHHAIIVTLFFGNAVISFLAAFIVSVMFEAPTIRLLKIVMNK